VSGACSPGPVLTRGDDTSAASDERDHDVGGTAVEVLSAVVVDGCGARIGVPGGQLDVAQREEVAWFDVRVSEWRRFACSLVGDAGLSPGRGVHAARVR